MSSSDFKEWGEEPLVKIHSSHISVERKFKASPKRVWDLITDTTKWRLWGPTVRMLTSSDRYIRKGTWGKVFTPIGLNVPFLITEYEYRYYWAWEVAGIRATGHQLIPTHHEFLHSRLRVAPFWMPYVIVCRAALKRMSNLLEP